VIGTVQFQVPPPSTKALPNPLVPGQQDSVSWTLAVRRDQHCAEEQVTVGSLVSQTDGASVQCGAVATFAATGNLLPEFRSISPGVIDTIKPGASVAFAVDVYDAERDTLTYIWYVNDVLESTFPKTFGRTFIDEGDYTVRLDIYDRCTLGGGPAVTHTWQVYVFNTTGIERPAVATEPAIIGNYPNPFNPGTVIAYRLPEGRHETRLDVLDAAGQLVRSLVSGSMEGGVHRIAFNAEGLPSGSYLVRLVAGGAVRTHRMLLVK
jgi:hypothetical protein